MTDAQKQRAAGLLLKPLAALNLGEILWLVGVLHKASDEELTELGIDPDFIHD